MKNIVFYFVFGISNKHLRNISNLIFFRKTEKLLQFIFNIKAAYYIQNNILKYFKLKKDNLITVCQNFQYISVY